MRKFVFILLIAALISGGTGVTAATTKDQPSKWAKAAVEKAIKLGLVPERLQSRYQSPITREEFAELIVQTSFKNYEYSAKRSRTDVYWTPEMVLDRVKLDFEFTDAKQDYVKLAFILGAVNGVSDTEFAPNRHITRQEAITMLMNMNHISEVVVYKPPEYLKYSDFDKIADWAKPAVQAGTTLMQGVGGKFDYNGKFTREQAISIMPIIYERLDTPLALRGDIEVYAKFSEIAYTVGKDYVKVHYREELYDFYTSQTDVTIYSSWRLYPATSNRKDEFTMEKGIVLYGFDAIHSMGFTEIVEPTLRGKPSKWDYGWMTVSIFNEDSLIEFKIKPIRGYMNRLGGYHYGYPTVQEVKVKRIS